MRSPLLHLGRKSKHLVLIPASLYGNPERLDGRDTNNYPCISWAWLARTIALGRASFV
jgi:hypothetical protein